MAEVDDVIPTLWRLRKGKNCDKTFIDTYLNVYCVRQGLLNNFPHLILEIISGY